jgi:hypothetical protein
VQAGPAVPVGIPMHVSPPDGVLTAATRLDHPRYPR